jgi:hypothetical protein
MEEKTICKWIVCDGNGTFLSEKENELSTSHIEDMKVFDNIGDAMKECSQYNKSRNTMRVMKIFQKKEK